MKTAALFRNLAAITFLVALVGAPAAAQERVAQVSKAEGDVQVLRHQDQSTDKVVQVGTRVRGGSLYSGDQIATGPGSTATVAFSDGTIVDLEADTLVEVTQTDQSAKLAAGKADKPIGRTIKLVAGNIFSDIAHNGAVATQFETPSGVAAVKGTRIRLSVDPKEMESQEGK